MSDLGTAVSPHGPYDSFNQAAIRAIFDVSFFVLVSTIGQWKRVRIEIRNVDYG